MSLNRRQTALGRRDAEVLNNKKKQSQKKSVIFKQLIGKPEFEFSAGRSRAIERVCTHMSLFGNGHEKGGGETLWWWTKNERKKRKEKKQRHLTGYVSSRRFCLLCRHCERCNVTALRKILFLLLKHIIN